MSMCLGIDEEHQRLVKIDSEDLMEFMESISDIVQPNVKTSEAMHYLDRASDHIKQAVEILTAFTEKYASK
jgi:hypothetical protein